MSSTQPVASSSTKAMRQMAERLLKTQSQLMQPGPVNPPELDNHPTHHSSAGIKLRSRTPYHARPHLQLINDDQRRIKPPQTYRKETPSNYCLKNYQSSSYSTIQDDDATPTTTTTTTTTSSSNKFSTLSLTEPNKKDDDDDNDPSSLLLLQDFWVRTKSPLNYNMTLLHQVVHGPTFLDADDDDLLNDESSSSFAVVSALAVPVKCFKTRVSHPLDLTGESPEGFLQCMTVLEQQTHHHHNHHGSSGGSGNNNRRLFSLFMSTGEWLLPDDPEPPNLTEETRLHIKFFKENSPHYFAVAWLPLTQLLLHHNVTGQEEIRDKVAITTVRRRIRIGSLKYKIMFGLGAQLKKYKPNQHQEEDLINMSDGGGGVNNAGRGSCGSTSLVVVTKNSNASCSRPAATNYSGLVVPPDVDWSQNLEDNSRVLNSKSFIKNVTKSDATTNTSPTTKEQVSSFIYIFCIRECP